MRISNGKLLFENVKPFRGIQAKEIHIFTSAQLSIANNRNNLDIYIYIYKIVQNPLTKIHKTEKLQKPKPPRMCLD